MDSSAYQPPVESVEQIQARQRREARLASLSQIDGALQDSGSSEEFWNRAQNALTEELEDASGWRALGDYITANAGPSVAIEAASKMARLFENGADAETINQEMLVAETEIKKAFDTIYNREKSGKPKLEVIEGGRETTSPLDFRNRIVDVAEQNGLDMTELAKEKVGMIKDFTTRFRDGGNRMSTTEFASVSDGILTFLKNPDNAYVFTSGKLNFYSREEIRKALDLLKRQVGGMRTGVLREMAVKLFSQIDEFKEENPF